jgi:formylglycine-generating enzyme required for sulfatase activity
MKYGLLAFIVFLLGLSASAEGKTHLVPLSLITNDLGMRFVFIHPGTFMMGSPENEKNRREDEVLHQVTLTRPFFMQITEVTQGQWKAVMGRNPSNSRDCGLNCPVESVSWLDCQEFVRKLNARGKDKYRLPTEAEWEYACRAGTDTPYYWGSSIDCTRAMYANNTLKAPGTCVAYARKRNFLTDSPAPVKSFPPNAWGIYDMAGNVWEWCQDWYGPYPMEPVVDPGGPPSGHKKVRRGGSFFKYGWYCRSANRNAADEYDRLRTLGFRLIMIVP